MAFQHKCPAGKPIRLSLAPGVDVFVSWDRPCGDPDRDSVSLRFEADERVKIETQPVPGEERLWPRLVRSASGRRGGRA